MGPERFDEDVPLPRDLAATDLPSEGRQAGRGRTLRGWWALALLAAAFGLIAASVSTRDFVAHLDGQTHGVQCSILPIGDATIGASGCKSAMMSTWSSFFRDSLWGGLPVSLLAMGVFAFFAALATRQLLQPSHPRRAGLLLVVASLLPVSMSVAYGAIAASELGAFCEVCVGIYIASGLLLIAGLGAFFRAPRAEAPVLGFWGVHVLVGVAFVGLPAIVYASSHPDPRPTEQGCGALADARDDAGILLRAEPSAASGAAPRTPAIVVLDPLCPACRSFDGRLAETGLAERLDARWLLMPLDARCNWMVKDSPHPGACAVSEAMLCAPDAAPRILAFAFAEQERLTALGKDDDAALRKELAAKFPETASCIGTAAARAKLNKSMRFAVKNALPVQTPQLWVDGRRLCDEDTDLGLEYTLGRWLDAPPGPALATPVEAPPAPAAARREGEDRR